MLASAGCCACTSRTRQFAEEGATFRYLPGLLNATDTLQDALLKIADPMTALFKTNLTIERRDADPASPPICKPCSTGGLSSTARSPAPLPEQRRTVGGAQQRNDYATSCSRSTSRAALSAGGGRRANILCCADRHLLHHAGRPAQISTQPARSSSA